MEELFHYFGWRSVQILHWGKAKAQDIAEHAFTYFEQKGYHVRLTWSPHNLSLEDDLTANLEDVKKYPYRSMLESIRFFVNNIALHPENYEDQILLSITKPN